MTCQPLYLVYLRRKRVDSKTTCVTTCIVRRKVEVDDAVVRFSCFFGTQGATSTRRSRPFVKRARCMLCSWSSKNRKVYTHARFPLRDVFDLKSEGLAS